jgi:hypothetical protein
VLDAELKAQEGKAFKSYDKTKELAIAAKAAGDKAAADAVAGKEKADAAAARRKRCCGQGARCWRRFALRADRRQRKSTSCRWCIRRLRMAHITAP